MNEDARRLPAVEAVPIAGRTQQATRPRTRSRVITLTGHGRAGMIGLGLLLLLIVWQGAALLVQDDVILPGPAETVGTWFYYLGHTYPTVGFLLWQHALFSTM